MADEKKNDQLNAVVIHRTEGEDGQVSIEVEAAGDVKLTEVGDLLASALILHRRKLGV
jgi:hypothetical protein